MTNELKTLKDLEEHFEEYYDEQVINNKHSFIPERAKILKSELKAEAVKWVKLLGRWDVDMKVFIDFFNLTEEDLK